MHRLVFLTDIHLTEGMDSQARFARDLAEIRSLTPTPDLLISGGDICLWSAEATAAFQEALRDCPIPRMHAMGNHDTTLDVPLEECGRDFEALLGPLDDCRALGRGHAITLNTCAMDPAYLGSRDWHNVLGWVPDRDLAWLERALAHIDDRDAPLLLCVHIPFFSTYPERMKGGQAERDVWVVGNADRVVELLRPFRRCTVLQGHLHENEHLEVEGIRFVSVGAIAGAWWSRQGFAECIDGSPRGYLIADLEGADLRLQYRAAGCAPEYQACAFTCEGRRYLNVFFGDASEEVEVLVDGTWQALPRAAGLAMQERWVSAHVWELPPGTPPAPLTVRTRLDGRAVRLDQVPQVERYMREAADYGTAPGP